MGGFFSAPAPVAPAPAPAAEADPAVPTDSAKRGAAAARARRTGRPLISGSPLGITQNDPNAAGAALQSTLGPRTK